MIILSKYFLKVLKFFVVIVVSKYVFIFWFLVFNFFRVFEGILIWLFMYFSEIYININVIVVMRLVIMVCLKILLVCCIFVVLIVLIIIIENVIEVIVFIVR